jgi:hypothetical protein
VEERQSACRRIAAQRTAANQRNYGAPPDCALFHGRVLARVAAVAASMILAASEAVMPRRWLAIVANRLAL